MHSRESGQIGEAVTDTPETLSGMFLQTLALLIIIFV